MKTWSLKKMNGTIVNDSNGEHSHRVKKVNLLQIEFGSEPGLDATFVIQMPLTNPRAQVSNANELPMMETSEGHYIGYYTATSNVKAHGVIIEVKVSDDYGNVARKCAEGKLYINTKRK
jgi:bacillopeptidase F